MVGAEFGSTEEALGPDTLLALNCDFSRSLIPNRLSRRSAAQYRPPRRSRATPATLPGVSGRPTQASALSGDDKKHLNETDEAK
jgi:hypothetical protein